jgi:DNA-binding beta-propeller fold protein YncE
MSVYAFGDDSAFGAPLGVAPLGNGDLIVLAARSGKRGVYRCNFRGDVLAPIDVRAPSGWEPGGEQFNPTFLAVSGADIYLGDKAAMRVLVVGLDGSYARSFDLKKLLKVPAKKALDVDARGMAVDRSGNLLFTVTEHFRAYVVAPDGKVTAFGTRGSSPGKFNVAGGIAADDEGHIYVTDVLRAVVMVFDADLKFLGEFGYRGPLDENLRAPDFVAAGGGRVFVSQSIGGVKVFGVRF